MPTIPRDWAQPFLEQAREDLNAAWAVPSDVCPATLCMLIQMVFEKIAKAAYARGGFTVPHTHRAASHLFAVLARHPTGDALLRRRPRVQWFVMELENAHPAIAGRQNPPWPQLGYPWEDGAGQVCYPSKDLYLAKEVQDPKKRTAMEYLKFARELEQLLTTIIP